MAHRGMRLKEFAETYKLKQKALAQRLDVSPGFISRIMTGQEDFTGKLILNLSEMFPLLNLNWLIRGDGPMLLARQEQILVQEPEVVYRPMPKTVQDFRRYFEAYERRLQELESEVIQLRKVTN